MSLAVALGIGVIGGVGAIARFLLDGAVANRARGAFPWGTFVVNITGAFLLGLLVGLALRSDVYKLAGTGLLGAFTTFSTWMLESHRLGEDGELKVGLVNFAISLIVGVVSAWAGQKVGAAL